MRPPQGEKIIAEELRKRATSLFSGYVAAENALGPISPSDQNFVNRNPF
jgi:hypothetical protein